MTNSNRVTHRPIGIIPGCVPCTGPTCPTFDERKYWESVEAFCQEIRDYVDHMNAVRAGLLVEQEAA